jgi:dihydroxy-acid dehydratase
MKEIESLLHGDAMTVTGKPVRENIESARCHNRDVIRSINEPLQASGGTIVLYGNLAPDGAVLKTSAATAKLMQHTGRAVVFEDRDDLEERLEDPNLDIDETCVMVLKNGGPVGAPGMPEYGNLPIPAKLLQQGVTDMVRISDSRMSGTSYGTVLLHVSPESAVGGPLAIVENGDLIQLDVANRQVSLLVPEEEIQRRLAAWRPRERHYDRGYGRLFIDHILQAHQGCDFDFLQGASRPAGSVPGSKRAADRLPLNY